MIYLLADTDEKLTMFRRMVESLPGLPEAVKPWDEIKAVMFGEVGAPDQWKGWCFFNKRHHVFGLGMFGKHIGETKKKAAD